MPELPEVEAVCRRLRGHAVGATIERARVVRPGIAAPGQAAAIERALAGEVLCGVERRGKNILLHVSGGHVLRVHLRMTGNLYVIHDYRLRAASVRMYLQLADGRAIVFEDPRALGRVSLHKAGDVTELLAGIGPEPLDPAFTAEAFAERARRSRKPAKLFLMDQSCVAGLGNIYAAEALFEAGIDPRRAMNRLSRKRLDRLHAAVLTVLRVAVDSATVAYATPGRFSEGESYPVAVYGREDEPCTRCGRVIRRIPQGGRSTYFCSSCQR